MNQLLQSESGEIANDEGDASVLASLLVESLTRLDSIVVAFSGGVDSSVVAAAATRTGKPCIAVTAKSPAVARWQLELASKVAGEIGIEHQVVETDESERAGYQRNAGDRCFYCKQTLYEFLDTVAVQRSGTIVSGTNADDLGDHRPGIQAGRDAGICTPLADLKFSKQDVRRLARHFGLSNADLPASPCLASRIAYHVEVTPKRLLMIEQAEEWLRSRGVEDLRVRLHADELARIEVPAERFAWLVNENIAGDLVSDFRAIGFRYVSLDLEGLRSGSLNQALVRLETVEATR